MLTPHQFQDNLIGAVYGAWDAGHKNVLMRADTGAGKTVMLSEIVRRHGRDPSCTFAHRQELVGQLSTTLARQGVRHNVIAPTNIVRAIAANHVAEVGASFFDSQAPAAVAAVDTLIRRPVTAWDRAVRLWIPDEAHHVLRDNKWGTAIDRFSPEARGLGPTATPSRPDGKGLGAHADGVFHTMVQAPPMRWLIDQGYLTEYRLVIPKSDLAKIDMGDVSADGDWSPQKGRRASVKARITGDVVEQYLKRAKGMLTIVFTTDVETADEMAKAFRQAGVTAACLTGEMPDAQRRQILRDFAARRIMVLVAVDIVSEGFDLPAVECGIFARPTMSLPLYMQQFGRALRVMLGKLEALIIDMAGNFDRHGLPDKTRPWTLDAAPKRAGKRSVTEPSFTCGNDLCCRPNEKWRLVCQYCGEAQPAPDDRSGPIQVMGDLVELDPAMLARLRGDMEDVDMDLNTFSAGLHARHIPVIGHGVQIRKHLERFESQKLLREAMALWGGARRAEALQDREIQRKFFLRFGVDVLTAQALPAREAEVLTVKVFEEFANGY